MSHCRVFWGSHGCRLERGHQGPHLCECAHPDWQNCPEGFKDSDGVLNVGAPPYYGPETIFYGEDVNPAIERQHEADWLRDLPTPSEKTH